MKLKIGYFADGGWAHQAFEKIIEDDSLEIVFMTLRYDSQDEILLKYAKKYDIPVVTSKNINAEEYMEQIAEHQADLFVSMSYNQIFKKKLIDFPPLKTINCHAGKLPFYRGRNVLNWVLINDESEFGITVHYIDEGIDTGDIIVQKVYPITDSDNYATLLKRAYQGCAECLYEGIKQIQKGEVRRISQDSIDPIGFYCGNRKEGDERLDWNQTSREIFNFVRAICSPGPWARTYNQDMEIKINQVHLIEGAHNYKNTIGLVVGKTKTGFLVKTKDTMIEVVEYECDGLVRVGDRLK